MKQDDTQAPRPHRTPVPRGVRRTIQGQSWGLMREALSDYYGLSHEYADILILLYERPGQGLTWSELGKLISSHQPPTRGALQERVHILRQTMEAEALDSWDIAPAGGKIAGCRYTLTDIGREEVEEAMRCCADALGDFAEKMAADRMARQFAEAA